jgi:hypothetical protein
MPERAFGIRVFSATRARDRQVLGETITDWIRSNPSYAIFDRVVMQSSDSQFHCVTIVLLYHY